ncbi:MAG: HAD family hydrolase [Rhizobiales bacterium]|nr:HAD family hydrolase [Hyphomicrobiales bacterium]MBI3673191.1 HAD family hydrolase [Hyphomicrobiales bacterium]
MNIRGILFDKDGTLIEVNATWVPIYRRMLMELFNVDAEGAELIMEKAGLDRATAKFLPGSVLAGGTTRQLIDIWWPGLDAEGAAEKVRILDHDYAPLVKDYLKPLMPLEPIFTELKSMGIKLGVATNDSHVSALSHMSHIGVIEHFEDIIAADTVAVPKPSGNMIRRFAEITGLAPFEIAMVGDNSHDMEEARNGGAGLAVAVLSGNAEAEHIAHLADYTIASVADLPALLRRLRAAVETRG